MIWHRDLRTLAAVAPILLGCASVPPTGSSSIVVPAREFVHVGVAAVESDRFVVIVDDDVIAITSTSVEKIVTGLPRGRREREAISRDGLVVAWQDGSQIVVRDRKGVLHYPDHRGSRPVLTPVGNLIAFECQNGVEVVSVPQCAPVASFSVGWTSALSFGPDGRTLACIARRRLRPGELPPVWSALNCGPPELLVYDVKTRRRLLRRTGAHSDLPSDLVFAKDGRKILVVNQGKLLAADLERWTKQLEDLEDAEVSMDVIPIAKCHVELVAPMRDGKSFVAEDESSVIRLFDSWGGELRRFPTIAGHASILLLSASEEFLLVGGDEWLALHDAKTGALLRVLQVPRLVVSKLEHRGTQLVATGQAVCTYDRATGSLLSVEPFAMLPLDPRAPPEMTTRSPDGELEARHFFRDKAVGVFESRTERQLWRVHAEWAGPFAFSRDSRLIAVTECSSCFLRLHDARTGALVATIDADAETPQGFRQWNFPWIKALCFSPDGREIACGLSDGSIVVHDVAGVLRK